MPGSIAFKQAQGRTWSFIFHVDHIVWLLLFSGEVLHTHVSVCVVYSNTLDIAYSSMCLVYSNTLCIA